ncbi:hypothetical protein K461DRAFT_274887 [Myriangium duriaei CBS 260.36]|uniref:Orc1-like AAA ATPase domain-containing protein n=1 Tax=Myriangium duriaei CBS 260.36 TaxID=1168546 RepID=A0A9P4MK29_9PEZI|nr:hypothetical protein K461DRAFT_274887 [Myriangium duriaei CBS 260.36]
MAESLSNASYGQRFIGRESQLKQLTLLLSESFSSPPTIVAHGPEATGKTALIQSYLQRSATPFVMLQCRECITSRHLLERIITECQGAHNNESVDGDRGTHQRCESINAFTVALSSILAGAEKFIIALDGIDELHDAPPSLVPAMARLGEMIPALTILLIVRYPTARFLRASGIPHIYFPPYNREQASAILSLDAPNVFPSGQAPEGYTEEELEVENVWVWSRFCQAVWDALAKGAANDLVSFRSICDRLWRPFVQPIVDGTFGFRDFSRLIVSQKRYLQEESCLEDSLIVEMDSLQSKQVTTHEFPYFTKWLLCAAYLASHNPARMDTIYFMKATERKRRKKGGGTAAGRQSKTRKIPRHLLSPAAFSLDRLLSILHAILPHDFTSNVDIYTQMATLSSLRLLVRSGIYSSDALDRTGKWRVTYNWDYTLRLARSLNFDITDYVAE